jgi:hypothetical protein
MQTREPSLVLGADQTQVGAGALAAQWSKAPRPFQSIHEPVFCIDSIKSQICSFDTKAK